MTEQELQKKLKELKTDKKILKVLPSLELFTVGSSLIYESKIVKDVYELGIINNINYLDLPSSYIYILSIIVSMAGYVSIKFIKELLEEETEELMEEIEHQSKVKKLVY